MSKKAVILFSGGVDSTTCLALAKSQGFECYTLTFDYGQSHVVELKAAQKLSHTMGAKEHQVFKLPINSFKGSALTDHALEIPEYKDSDEIPITYVPARNTIFLSVALAYAEILEAYNIFIGISAVDYSNYADCRPEYIAQFEKLANLATKKVGKETFRIHAPLVHLSKAQTIEMGMKLEVEYGQTITCYRADQEGRACGTCDACFFRKKGFQEANITDPTQYLPN